MSEDNKYPFEENDSKFKPDDFLDDAEIIAEDQGEDNQDGEVVDEALLDNGARPVKQPKKVSLLACVICVICVALAAVMTTYSICLGILQNKKASSIINNDMSSGIIGGADITNRLDANSTIFDVLELFFSLYSFEEIDREAMVAAAIKAYVDATGDMYAEYYTAEEWAMLNSESAGESQGIGINIINSTLAVNGAEIKVFKVINIMKDSPAMGKLKIGDMIAFVGTGESAESVDSLGYSEALSSLKGDVGTVAEFSAYRDLGGGRYELIDFSIARANVTTSSIYYRVDSLDSSVGIVKILEFDQTTPQQFCEAVESLKAVGCSSFVFDLRYNPGGSRSSITAVLSYFLNEGDTVIHTSDKSGNYVTTKVAASSIVPKEDIGKYRDLNCVVLCNGETASAAELFTAVFRDYELATIVGTTTYGKGSMQSLIDLSMYGYEGGLRFTTRMYYPPCGESYDGIGIEPDVTVELDESLKNVNIYEIKDEDDNQLRKAIEYLK